MPAVEALAQRAGAPIHAFPSRSGPLLAILGKHHAALASGATLVICDLVWQTAPTPDLARAFAPPPGHEKIRPIEGYEMQIEHAGFEVVERIDVPRAEWAPLHPAQQSALAQDERGAAKVAAWLLRRID